MGGFSSHLVGFKSPNICCAWGPASMYEYAYVMDIFISRLRCLGRHAHIRNSMFSNSHCIRHNI